MTIGQPDLTFIAYSSFSRRTIRDTELRRRVTLLVFWMTPCSLWSKARSPKTGLSLALLRTTISSRMQTYSPLSPAVDPILPFSIQTQDRSKYWVRAEEEASCGFDVRYLFSFDASNSCSCLLMLFLIHRSRFRPWSPKYFPPSCLSSLASTAV